MNNKRNPKVLTIEELSNAYRSFILGVHLEYSRDEFDVKKFMFEHESSDFVYLTNGGTVFKAFVMTYQDDDDMKVTPIDTNKVREHSRVSIKNTTIKGLIEKKTRIEVIRIRG